MRTWNGYLGSLDRPVVATTPAGARAMNLPQAVPGAPQANLGPKDSFLSVRSWWEAEYESAQDWYLKNYNVALAAAPAGTATDVPLFQFIVPGTFRMVLKQFIIGVTNPTTAIDVTVALLRNNQPIPGYEAVGLLPMNAVQQYLPFNDLNLRFGSNDTFTARFTNNNAATAWTVQISASGWYVSQADIDRLQGGLDY